MLFFVEHRARDGFMMMAEKRSDGRVCVFVSESFRVRSSAEINIILCGCFEIGFFPRFSNTAEGAS